MSSSNKPLVTGLIPSYNHAKYIKESIQSMIDQDYENMEMIIIDDGSSDNSIEIIESMIPLCKKRFKRFEFRHRENKGVSATLNEGIMWSKGKYLSPLASDDMAMPNKTSYLVDKLEKSGHKAAFGSVTDMMNGKLIFGEKSQKTIYKFYDLFLLKKFIHGTASLINIDALKNSGLYNEDIAVEDLYMWLKLTEDGSNLICYPKVLAKYRTHDNNTVKYIDIMYKNLLNIINLYKNNKYYDEALRNAKVILVKLVKNLDDYILTNNSSLDYYNGIINDIITQAIECRNNYNKLAVYGYGTITNLIKDYLPETVIFFDKRASYINSKDKIYNLNEITKQNFDKVLISAIGHEKEIIDLLTQNYKISIDKIYVFNL